MPLAPGPVAGFEPSVFRGAKRLLSQHKVESILLEYSPGFLEYRGLWDKLEDFPQMLTVRDLCAVGGPTSITLPVPRAAQDVLASGYRAAWLDDQFSKEGVHSTFMPESAGPDRSEGFFRGPESFKGAQTALPPLREVTEEMLQHDIMDCRLRSANRMASGCRIARLTPGRGPDDPTRLQGGAACSNPGALTELRVQFPDLFQ